MCSKLVLGYFALMNCKYCNELNCIKRGKRNNVQRYYCNSCHCSFQNGYSYKVYDLGTNDLIKNLLKEGCGIRSISRIIGVSTKTVLSRMLQISVPLLSLRYFLDKLSHIRESIQSKSVIKSIVNPDIKIKKRSPNLTSLFAL